MPVMVIPFVSCFSLCTTCVIHDARTTPTFSDPSKPRGQPGGTKAHCALFFLYNTKRRSATLRRPGGEATPNSNRTVELRAATARAGFGELAPVRLFRWPTPRRLLKAGPVLPLL